MGWQDEIDRYKKKKKYWDGVRTRLQTAYNGISKDIKPEDKNARTAYQTSGGDTGQWKGDTLKTYEDLFDEIKNALTTHKDKIDAAHDTINNEIADAKSEYNWIVGHLEWLWAQVENAFNDE